jgi:hypothetical protein
MPSPNWLTIGPKLLMIVAARAVPPLASNLPSGSLLGGELPGGVKVKLGDNVGVGDNGGNFKAGIGLPF